MAATNDEQDWIQRSRNGDHEAFEALVKSYQRMIHSLTFRMTGSLADAEDLAQETFCQAYSQLGTYRAEARFSSWLYRIAVNRCLNWKKRQAHREQLHAEWSRRQATAAESKAVLAQRVQESLMTLNAKQRAALVLTVYDGLSHAEAARVLGCSETTISWRIFVARNKLKRLLKANADE